MQPSSWHNLSWNKQNIIFFDGVCNLCNATVNMLIDLDTRQNLVFAPLQGETYHQYCLSTPTANNTPQTDSFSTIVFWQQEREYVKSDAAIRIIACLGGFYRISLGLLCIPRFLRNILYDSIARNRYRWFGKSELCRIPTPELLARFLP
jgi:predicted DCC family thiol-disulfide oxidoreductase YuxK